MGQNLDYFVLLNKSVAQCFLLAICILSPHHHSLGNRNKSSVSHTTAGNQQLQCSLLQFLFYREADSIRYFTCIRKQIITRGNENSFREQCNSLEELCKSSPFWILITLVQVCYVIARGLPKPGDFQQCSQKEASNQNSKVFRSLTQTEHCKVWLAHLRESSINKEPALKAVLLSIPAFIAGWEWQSMLFAGMIHFLSPSARGTK